MDEHHQIIKKLPIWQDSSVEVAPLSGGITNFNYLVRAGRKKYVARFAPKSNRFLGLNRAREIYNTKIAARSGLAPDVKWFFPKQSLLIVEYLEGTIHSSKLARTPAQIEQLAELLKTLHSGPKFRGNFNPFQTIQRYLRIAKKRQAWMPKDFARLLQEFGRLEKKIGRFYNTYPCHLDLVMANIIGHKNTVRFLDWEYSANSDYLFDLAMLSVMGKYTKPEDELLLKTYGRHNVKVYNRMQAMKAVVSFREVAWALVQMVTSPIKFDYKKHAKINLAQFRCHLRLKEF